MPTLPQLKSKWLIGASDVPAGTRVPPAWDGAEVSWVVDGEELFKQVYEAIDALTGKPFVSGGKTYKDFVYIANWNLEAGLPLPDPGDAFSQPLVRLLGEKAQQGVDVRVLLWYSPWALAANHIDALRWIFDDPQSRVQLAASGVQGAQGGIVQINYTSAQLLRLAKALAGRVLLDWGAYILGAHHMKVVCVYDATTNDLSSWCGGMDLVRNRHTTPGHAGRSPLPFPGSAAAPTLSDTGPGSLPAGTYHVQARVKFALPGGSQGEITTTEAAITLPASRKLKVADLPDASSATAAEIGVFARRDGQHQLPQLAFSSKDKTLTETDIDGDPATWGIELTGWEWHDVAVRQAGPAAANVTELIQKRWNEVVGYPPLNTYETIGQAVIGPLNPTGPPVQATAPTLTDAGAGALPEGQYELCYTMEAILGSLDLLMVSAAAKLEIPANHKLAVAGLPTTPPITGASVTKRSIWARPLGSSPAVSFRLVADIADPALTTAEVNTAPGTWTTTLDSVASFAPANAPSPADSVRSLPAASTQQSSQVLLTVADVSGPLSWLSGTTRHYSFVPEEGEFTVYYAYRKAIASATSYVYIEDQAMASEEIMELIGDRMLSGSAPSLKVLLLTSGIADPADAAAGIQYAIGWNESIFDKLINRLPTARQGDVKLFRSRGLTVHSKLVVIDDEWAAVGSANMLDRSFSTDTELQVGVVDAAGTAVRDLRKHVWAEHLSIDPADLAYTVLDDPDKGLNMWVAAWGTAHGATLPALRRAVEIPLPAAATTPSVLSPTYWRLKLQDWTTHDF